jgi:hypothetical protein
LNLVGSSVIPNNTSYVLIAGTGSTTTGLTGVATPTSGQYAGLETFVNSLGQNQISNTSLGGLNLAFTNGAGSFYPGSYLYLVNTGGVDDIDVEVVPEPKTWALLFAGGALLVFWQRRKNRVG